MQKRNSIASLAAFFLLIPTYFASLQPLEAKVLSSSELDSISARQKKNELLSQDQDDLVDTARDKNVPGGLRTRAYLLMSSFYYDKGEPILAQKAVEEALAIEPGNAEALAQRAFVNSFGSDFETVLKYYDAAVNANPTVSWLYFNRGEVRLSHNKVEEAISDFDKVINLSKEPNDLNATLAGIFKIKALRRLSKYAEELEIARVLLKNDIPAPLRGELYMDLGCACYKLGKLKEAITYFTDSSKFQEKIADRGEAIYLRGFCYHDLKDEKQALKDLETAKSLGFRPPGSPPLDHVVGLTASTEEQFKPLIEKARQTLPEAKARFLKGLPANHSFSVTVRLVDSTGKREQVFIGVRKWEGDVIHGDLLNDVHLKGFKSGQSLIIKESDVLDWTIVNEKGEEEGNLIGKYIDELMEKQRQQQQPESGKII